MGIDVYPQWLNLTSVTEAVAGTLKQSETKMPIRIENLQVMEILKIQFEITGGSISGIDADHFAGINGQITETSETTLLALNDRNLIQNFRKLMVMQFAESTETGGGAFTIDYVFEFDYDVGGKGFLYAGVSMFLAVKQDSSAPGVASLNARLLYKLVKVSANELIGLVRQ